MPCVLLFHRVAQRWLLHCYGDASPRGPVPFCSPLPALVEPWRRWKVDMLLEGGDDLA